MQEGRLMKSPFIKRVFRLSVMSLAALCAFLVLFILVATGAFTIVAYRSLPALEGNVILPGLQKPVQIERDDRGFVTIKASSQQDAYMALGFVHAQDRLWQMEEMRLIGAGRLGEVLGPLGIQIDKFIRTFDLYGKAKAQQEHLLPGARRAVEAYTRGVNAFLQTRDRPLPPEFQALFHTPEPWTETDSLVWGQLMSFTLSGNWRSERRRERWSRFLTPEMLQDILPNPSAEDPITLSHAAQSLLDNALDNPLKSASASNAWILSGDHTETGYPVLANDPHLGFSAPNLWYFVRIEAPGLSVTGVTVPGVPFHILGHTDRIAWGMTTTYADTQDLFVETLGDDAGHDGGHDDSRHYDGRHYDTVEGSKAVHIREELIKNRFGDDLKLIVRETRNGPLISDLWPESENWGNTAIALSFAAHKQPDTTPNALYLLNRAQNQQDFIEAAKQYRAPIQNLHYADRDGVIGLIAAGAIPIRKGGNGLLPANGASGTHDWIGFIPFEGLPQQFNPTTGWIRNANNQIVSDEYPYLISRDHQSGHRARRLDELWKSSNEGTRNEKTLHGIEDSLAWQLDTVSTSARKVLPTLLIYLKDVDTERAKSVTKILQDWDGSMNFEGPAPLIYATWSTDLARRLGVLGFKAQALEETAPRSWRDRDGFILNALSNPVWCGAQDDPAGEISDPCAERVLASFDETLKSLQNVYGDAIEHWSWQHAHKAQFDHRIFGKIPVLNRFFSREIATVGDDNTLNRGLSTSDQDGGFRHIHGSGYRAVYDLSNLDASRFSLAIGQSGHFLSPHYDDLMQDWASGSYFTSDGRGSDGKSLNKAATKTLTLTPD